VKTIEEMLQNLVRPNVTEFALVSARLPCIKVNGQFKPVDDSAPTTEDILQMLVTAGGSWYVASLGPQPTQWTVAVEGIGTIGIQAVMRDNNVQARFMVVQRDPFAAAAPPPPPVAVPPPPSTVARPQQMAPPTSRGSPPQASQPRTPPRANQPFPPEPPSSSVALIANEPFLDDDVGPRTGVAGATAPRMRPPASTARQPLPPPQILPTEPGGEDAADPFLFDAPAPKAPLPAPSAPEAAAVPNWKATQVSSPGPPMRPRMPTQPEAARAAPMLPDLVMPGAAAAGGGDEGARAAMDGLVLRLAEELDVGPRRVRVIIELVLETIDRTGLPPREALEALAAAEKKK
jgi:hypothetical protein